MTVMMVMAVTTAMHAQPGAQLESYARGRLDRASVH